MKRIRHTWRLFAQCVLSLTIITIDLITVMACLGFWSPNLNGRYTARYLRKRGLSVIETRTWHHPKGGSISLTEEIAPKLKAAVDEVKP